MDMPIKLMITLFVAVIVGATMIFFVKEVVEDSKADLKNNRPGIDLKEVEDQQIIQLNMLTSNQIIDLMLECYERNHLKTFNRERCFVVIASDADSWSWSGDIEPYFSAHTDFHADVEMSSDVQNGDDALTIYFDPSGSSETIVLAK